MPHAYWPAAFCRTKRPHAVSFADELQTAGNTAQNPFSIQWLANSSAIDDQIGRKSVTTLSRNDWLSGANGASLFGQR